MRVFNDFFWGILLIVIGVILLLKYILNINIPVFRTILGVLFIYIGITIIIGGTGIKDKSNIIFSSGRIKGSSIQREYNIIFGSGTIDLSDIEIIDETKKIEVNTIFSQGTIIIKEGTPVVIKASSAFAQARTPDGVNINFGDTTYKPKDFDSSKPYIEIDANVVFGNLEIIER